MQPYVLLPSAGSSPADEWLRLGIEAQTTGKFQDAERHYRNVLRMDPTHAIVTTNLAVLLAQQNRLVEGILAAERATLLDPTKEIAWMNWALMALEMEQYDVALAAAEAGVAAKATAESRLALAMVLTALGRAEDAVPVYDAILAETPIAAQAGYNACFARTLMSPAPEDFAAAKRRWYETHRDRGPQSPHANDRALDRPLRIGYVSGDFKRHSAAFLFSAVVCHHDRAHVIPYCYSTLPVDPAADPVTAKFQAATEWRDISGMTEEQADVQIRKDGIDVLVDLSGHTGGNRLLLFTRKPAPIQVTGWGFAHGTGISEIDYFFVDPVALPEDERAHFVEQAWDLPCIVPYDPPDEYQLRGTSPPPVNRDDDGWFTFGVFSRYEKLSGGFLAACRAILERVPESRLLFKDAAFRRPACIRRVLRAMEGVYPLHRRLLFALDTSHADHMLAYQQADLVLDPFPHTGGVVGIEQLYMGVPVVTLYGRNPGERTTSSVLTVLNRAGWIARTPEDYVDLAVAMSKDRQELALARRALRGDLLASPLCVGYVDAVETAYRRMWTCWVERA